MQLATHVKTRKRRNPNACDLCKKKKVRCDSAVMPDNRCTECISYNCDCLHSGKYVSYHGPPAPPKAGSSSKTASVRSDAPSPRSSPTNSSILHPLVAAVIALLPPSLNSAAIIALERISSHVFDLERQVSGAKGPAVSKNGRPDQGPALFGSAPIDNIYHDDEDDSDIRLAEQLSDLKIEVGQGGRYFGPSSTMSLVGMTLKTIADSNKGPDALSDFRGVRRPAYWNLSPWETELHEDLPLHEFPDASLMDDLIEVFFAEVNVLLPLLHKPTFLQAVAENKHILDPLFGEVVLGVCALASRWSPDPRVLLESDDKGHSAGWRWFRQIRLFRKTFARSPSVYELQTNILAVLYIGGTSQPELAWVLLATGLRYAIEVGAHRKRPHPTPDGELWKRAFWIIWVYEALLSSFLGRPRATVTDDLDLDMPIDCNDEYWQPADPQNAFKQPANVPSTMSGFISFINLIRILNYTQEHLFSIKVAKGIASGRHDAQDTVACIDSQLDRWFNAIPNHLHLYNFHDFDVETFVRLAPTSPTAMLFKQAIMLQGTYHQVQIHAHRPFIFFARPGSRMWINSWAVCTNSARAGLRVLNIVTPFINMHWSIMPIAVISLLEKWKIGTRATSPGMHGASWARESVLQCLDLLSKYESRWIGAGRAIDVIRELLYLDDLVSGNQASNSSSPSSATNSHGRQKDVHLRTEDIFTMATNSFPTFDRDFLGSSFNKGEDGSLAMLF